MTALLVFAVVLLVAVLLSEYASRTVLSTSVLFLCAGYVAGPDALGLIEVDAEGPFLGHLAEVALFSVLFTDGMQAGIRDLRRAWRLPGRALLLGLPLTFLFITLLAWGLAGLTWPQAMLVGAALSPTDPVFASAIVGREEVPWRLRQLLNVESGLNDGLALPVVLVMLGLAGAEQVALPTLAGEVALGIVVGVGLPLAAMGLERLKPLKAVHVYEPIFAFAIGLLIFAVCAVTHANEFLAAFFGGVTIASVSPEARQQFHAFGELLVELFKLGALLYFGALISLSFFGDFGIGDYFFAALVILIARPVAIGLAMLGGELDWREWIAAAWFGPKGFASVVYAILILESGLAGAESLFQLMAVAIALSIIAHSSTDVPLAAWFRRHHDVEDQYEQDKLERAQQSGDLPNPSAESVREAQME
jgi:NhaP-type Na+/H+ or K+/H+ antiporter